jgi:hypothetical protein
MVPLQLPIGFKYKFFFYVNILNVIKVGSSNEGSGGVAVYSAFKCITLEVDVGLENVAIKCGDVPNTNPMEEKKEVKEWEINWVFLGCLGNKVSMGGNCAWDRWENEHGQVLCLLVD